MPPNAAMIRATIEQRLIHAPICVYLFVRVVQLVGPGTNDDDLFAHYSRSAVTEGYFGPSPLSERVHQLCLLVHLTFLLAFVN